MKSANTTPRRRRPIAAAAAVAVIVAALSAGVLLMGAFQAKPQSTAIDMRGHQVQFDEDAVPVAGSRDTRPDTATRLRFRAASVGLNVPLERMNEAHGVLTPPGFTAAYTVNNLGVGIDHASTGTVYIAMHSLRNGGIAPGNYLIDERHQRATIREGETITVGSLRYRVTSTALMLKTDVPHDRSLWANTPNRLVVLTCLQQANGHPSTRNLIISAVRA
jgi:hypothetical protein